MKRKSLCKRACTGLGIVILVFGGSSRAQSGSGQREPGVTKAEEKEARQLAIDFTTRFAETRDLGPIVKEFYFSDFIDRYKKSEAESLKELADDVFFAPGLDHHSRLLTDAGSEDWQRFYVAANNFLLVGFVAAMKEQPDEDEDFLKLFPSEVVTLMSKNPNLANMILKKDRRKPVSSVEEMQNACASLEQAVAIMREKYPGKPIGDDDRKKMIELMRNNNFFRPDIEIAEEEYFGFPESTRILFIKTPLGLTLMLAKQGDRLKIFWTQIIAD